MIIQLLLAACLANDYYHIVVLIVSESLQLHYYPFFALTIYVKCESKVVVDLFRSVSLTLPLSPSPSLSLSLGVSEQQGG